MKTKNKSKKGIGILLAAIMVISIFAVVMPAFGWYHPPEWPAKGNLSIDKPIQDSCVRGTELNFTFAHNTTGDPMTLYEYVYVGIFDCETNCSRAIWEIYCAPGCNHYLMNFSLYPWNTVSIPACSDLCVYVWNGTRNIDARDSVFRNGTKLKIDKVAPCIEPVSPVGGQWYNCSSAIDLNVSACDSCCGLKNVTANISAISKEDGAASKQFENASTSAGTICEDMTTECTGWYYHHEIGTDKLKTSCGIVDIPVTARDTAIDSEGQSNTAETTLSLGVDCDDPEKVKDPSCEETPGAITVTWPAADDDCSGVAYYKIYGKHLNASNPSGSWVAGGTFYAGKTDGPVLTFDYTGRSPESEYCNWYQFNISAVDNAGNEGEFSNYTSEPQHLTPGNPSILELTLKDYAIHASGQKITMGWDFINASVTDTHGVGVGDIKVKFNATKGMPFPPENTTASNGFAHAYYQVPQSVPVQTNTTICAWLPDYPDISMSCKNLTLLPQEATSIRCTATPPAIDANSSTDTSTIAIQLMSNEGADGKDHPVYGTIWITLETTAGTFENDLQSINGYTDDTGAFSATLSPTVGPAVATVTAYAGGTGVDNYVWTCECTVAFLGPVTEFSMDLRQGRNDISIPLWAKNTTTGDYDPSVENVLASLGTNVQSVYYYDAEEEEWLVWLPGGTPPNGVLTNMEPGKGYQVYMSASDTLTITGTFLNDDAEVPTTHEVVLGWNMIGFHSLNAGITPREYIEGPSGRTTGIEYQEPLWTYHAGYRSTGGSSTIYDYHYMQPGWGYWVYITDDAGVIIPHWE